MEAVSAYLVDTNCSYIQIKLILKLNWRNGA